MVNGNDLFNDYLTEGNNTINIFYSFGNKKYILFHLKFKF